MKESSGCYLVTRMRRWSHERELPEMCSRTPSYTLLSCSWATGLYVPSNRRRVAGFQVAMIRHSRSLVCSGDSRRSRITRYVSPTQMHPYITCSISWRQPTRFQLDQVSPSQPLWTCGSGHQPSVTSKFSRGVVETTQAQMFIYNARLAARNHM